jgi:hypothetical protein
MHKTIIVQNGSLKKERKNKRKTTAQIGANVAVALRVIRDGEKGTKCPGV